MKTLQEIKKEIIDYLWERKINKYSAENMLFLYRELNDLFLDWKLHFDVIDDYCGELYIICSIDVEITENKRFSIVIDRNAWSSDAEDTAEKLVELYEKSKDTEDYFKF